MIASCLRNLETPFFYLDRAQVRNGVTTLKKAFEKYWNNYIIGYSVKTNSLPALAKEMLLLGVSAEVVSHDEYEMAKAIGFPANRILCNGPIKKEEWLNSIVKDKVKVNIDSNAEVEYFKSIALLNANEEYSVGIRVNLDAESIFGSEINTDSLGSRFGFSYENRALEKVLIDFSQYSNIHITGLHFHVNSNSRSLEIYSWIAEMFVQIVKKYELRSVSYVDFGGGFFGGVPGKPTWDDYVSQVTKVLSREGFCSKNLCVIFEPGVSLLANSLTYYTRVVDIKYNSVSAIAILDGSRVHIDPFFHKKKGQYFYTIHNESMRESTSVCNSQLTGYTCLESDRFFKEEGFVAIGDILEFNKVGAYTLTLSPLFITYFPAVYALADDGKLICVRQKWTVREFLQKSEY